MKKRGFFLALLFLLFGIFILTSSLISYAQKEAVGSERLSKRRFYFAKRVLPDHIFYPVLMVVDRVLLSLTKGEAKVFLEIKLAQDRMITGNKLLELGQEDLALSTLTKSQKYLILAARDLFSQDNYSIDTAKVLLVALKENTDNLSFMEQNFKVVPTEPIGDLIVESQAIISEIESKIQG